MLRIRFSGVSLVIFWGLFLQCWPLALQAAAHPQRSHRVLSDELIVAIDHARSNRCSLIHADYGMKDNRSPSRLHIEPLSFERAICYGARALRLEKMASVLNGRFFDLDNLMMNSRNKLPQETREIVVAMIVRLLRTMDAQLAQSEDTLCTWCTMVFDDSNGGDRARAIIENLRRRISIMLETASHLSAERCSDEQILGIIRQSQMLMSDFALIGGLSASYARSEWEAEQRRLANSSWNPAPIELPADECFVGYEKDDDAE